MKNTVRLISLFVFAACFSGCIETVSLNEIGIKPKLVLYCFLSPQYDTISVSLTNSQPLFSYIRGTMAVTNATVEISNDNQHWTQIRYNKASRRYLLPQSQFPILEGKTYYIRAAAPDYESISASCTVPFWRETDLKPETEFVPTSKNNLYSYASLYFSWKDSPGEENYYAFMQYGLYEYYDYKWDYNHGVWLYDTTINLNAYLVQENSEVVFSDVGKDGGKMSVPWTRIDCSFSEFMENDYFDNDYNECYIYKYNYDSIYILFVQTDKNAFLYENSASAAENMGFMDIFTIEPALVYSNIKNGYGVFGAMTFKPYRANFRQKTIEEAECPKPQPSGEMRKRK